MQIHKCECHINWVSWMLCNDETSSQPIQLENALQTQFLVILLLLLLYGWWWFPVSHCQDVEADCLDVLIIFSTCLWGFRLVPVKMYKCVGELRWFKGGIIFYQEGGASVWDHQFFLAPRFGYVIVKGWKMDISLVKRDAAQRIQSPSQVVTLRTQSESNRRPTAS